MNRNILFRRSLMTLAIAIALSLVAAIAPAAQVRAGDVEVLPYGGKYYGLTYEELSSRWWKWALEQPADVNPVLDTTGADCQQGQRGRIWFLAGTFGGNATRTCTIPRNRVLFVPVLNSWADNSGITGNETCPPTTYTEEELRSFIAPDPQVARITSLEVDGQAVDVFRVDEGTVFSYRIPSDSVHDVLFSDYCGADFPRQQVRGAVSNGDYTLLAPLPVGSHTIHIHGEIGDAFALDVTYILTVS